MLTKSGSFYVDHQLFSANCYSYHPWFKRRLEGGTLSEADFSIDYIESTPIKFMANTECRRFLNEDMNQWEPNQYNQEIICFNTIDLEYDQIQRFVDLIGQKACKVNKSILSLSQDSIVALL